MNEANGYAASELYDRVVVPRYAGHFAELLLNAFEPETRSYVLALACRTGFALPSLLQVVNNGRVVGLDEDDDMLDIARNRLGEEAGLRAFVSTGSVDDLAFGDGVFSHVVGNLIDRASPDRGVLLSEISRVLRAHGQVVLTMPLRGSFVEVLDMLREVALKYDVPAVSERVEQYVQSLPTPQSWVEELTASGFDNATVHEKQFLISYEPGHALMDDPAALVAGAPEWQWCAMGAPDAAGVMARMQNAIDTYFQGRRFELTVIAGCISARRVAR